MAEPTPTPPKGKGKGLGKKVGPLPLWLWLGLGAGGALALYLYLRGSNGGGGGGPVELVTGGGGAYSPQDAASAGAPASSTNGSLATQVDPGVLEQLSSQIGDVRGHVTELEDAYSRAGFALNEDKTWSVPGGEGVVGDVIDSLGGPQFGRTKRGATQPPQTHRGTGRGTQRPGGKKKPAKKKDYGAQVMRVARGKPAGKPQGKAKPRKQKPPAKQAPKRVPPARGGGPRGRG